MMEELSSPARRRRKLVHVWPAHTEEGDPAYKVVSPYDSLYVLPGADASVFFAGPRLEPLAAARAPPRFGDTRLTPRPCGNSGCRRLT